MMKPKSKQQSERGARFAQGGGANKMFKEQVANPATSGRTGKIQSAAPGAKRAAGGPKTRGAAVAMPAVPAHTAPPRKGR